MNVLQQQLDKLRVPQSAVRQYAVAAVFDALRSPGAPQHARDAAARQCLELRDPRALEVAVAKLQELALSGDWRPLDAIDALMAALAVADAPSCGPLARGVLAIWSTAGPAGGVIEGPAKDWRTHVLSRALQSNPSAAQPLLLGTLSLLARAAGTAGAAGTPTAASFQALLAALRPFLAFVLLSPDLAHQGPGLSPELHASLARFACCTPWVPAQHATLTLLVAYLPAHLVQQPGQQGAVQAAVGDIMDLVESCTEEPDPEVMAALARHLFSLCYELSQHGGPLQPPLAALHRLAAYWPELLVGHLVDTAQLIAASGGQECAGLLSLLARQLAHASKAQGLHPAVHALVRPPLLQLLAFQQDPALKQWASHCLALLSKVPSNADCDPVGAGAGACHVSWHGAAAMAGQALQLLAEMWRDDRLALDWLGSLSATLADATSAPGSQAGPKDQRGLCSHASAMLCALLYHPEPSVQVAAVAAVDAAVQAVPLLGMTLLPVLVHRSQQLVEAFLSGQTQEPPAGLLPMLQALPLLARHAAVVPFVVRAIQPLLSPGAPELLQALALRLLCLLWRRGGRGYQQLRTAILGFAPPGQAVSASLELRVTRAESVREICEEDPTKGVELIRVVQECLDDPAPQVQALGLQSISLLCESDALDFYAAWRVVQARFPTLPAHPKTAVAWVELMSQGVLDADVYPEVAKAILSALWLATGHHSPQVRRQAYASLAQYSLALQEQIEALPALVDFVELLQQEAHCGNRAACESLVIKALAHEHATRRRPGAGLGGRDEGRSSRARPSRAGAVGGGGGDSSVVTHRLLSTLPRLLLGVSASSASEVLQRLPELSSVAVLNFYAAPPPSNITAAGTAAAARDAAAAYQQVFAELLRQPNSAQLGAAGGAAGAACLPAWRRFLKRWAAAVRAAGGSGGPGPAEAGAAAQAASAMQLWGIIQPHLSSASPLVGENAAWAAAALCSIGTQPVKEAVHAVHAELLGLARSAQAPAAVQRAALAALGSLAGHARAVLGLPVVEATFGMLTSALLAGPSNAARAAAAEGLSLACRELHGGLAAAGASLEGAPRDVMLVALGSLLSMLCTLCQPSSGPGAADLEAAALASGIQLVPPLELDERAIEDVGLLQAVCSGLTLAVPAAADLAQPPFLPALHSALLRMLGSSAAQQEQQQQQMQQAAMYSLLTAVTSEAFRRSWISSSQVSASLELLLSALRPAPALDGRALGAAAAALGAMLPAALPQGYSAQAGQAPEAVLQILLPLAESGAAKLAHAAAAKQGIAAGIAGLLGPGSRVEPGGPPFKAALKALEGLALSDIDPRVRKACAGTLAQLCCQFKGRQPPRAGAAAGAEGGVPAAAAKSLAALSEEGAMRPLVETLLEGRWAPGVDSSQEDGGAPGPELTAAASASILRCLAAAERLPALNFGTLCRRLLRGHPGDPTVAEGCIRLAAAHAQVQACQLSDFVAEAFEPSRFLSLGAPAQLAALKALPRLLSALPDSQAIAALRALGTLCPDLSGGPAGDSAQQAAAKADWIAALLSGLRGLLAGQQQAGPGGGSSVPVASPAPQQAAQQQLVETVLPRLPPPAALPVSLSGPGPEGAGLEDGSTGRRGCWEAAVQCFAALPAAKVEALLCSPQLCAALPLRCSYLAAALVSRGSTAGLGARALQAPRNLLLNGSLGGRPEEEGAVALFLGRAVAASLSITAQQQWLLEVLDAAKACARPEGALKLACCVLSCAAGASAGAQTDAELAVDHVTAVSCHAGIATLAHSLALLAESPAWQGSLAGVLNKLSAAVSAAEAEAGAAGDRREEGPGWGKVLLAALLAARRRMPAELWNGLAARLA